MLHVAKTLLSSCCMGFRQGRRSPEAEKKASPPPNTFQKTLRLAKQRFSPASPLQFITSPPLPLPTASEDFSPSLFLVSCLTKCKLFVYLCSYVILRGGGMHVSSLPYLILHLRFAFSHPIFVQNQSLIPYLFQSTQQWAFLNMFQASKSSWGFASTLL